jgi:hypothetical protein
VTLPASGEWTVDLHVRTASVEEYSVTVQLTVR